MNELKNFRYSGQEMKVYSRTGSPASDSTAAVGDPKLEEYGRGKEDTKKTQGMQDEWR